MIFIESESMDPYFNLALEEYVFESMDPSETYFMLWQNKNTIVVGKYQNTAEEINQDFVDEHGIKVVRRLSGGGAVYHDEGNLNFTFIVSKELNPEYDFHLFVIPVINALKELGIEASFTGRNDITIDGKKISGNSQYAKRDRIMHHGCIMLDSDLKKVEGALRVKEAKFESKSIKSVRSRVTTINAHAPRRITMDEFKQALKKQAFAEHEMKVRKLTEYDLSAVRKLASEKYAAWEWNYGRYPKYGICREQKFESGLVTIRMEVDHGHIQNIRIAGDFFGDGEIADLESQLIGLPLDDSLAEKLDRLNIGTYMHGISAKDLAGILR